MCSTPRDNANAELFFIVQRRRVKMEHPSFLIAVFAISVAAVPACAQSNSIPNSGFLAAATPKLQCLNVPLDLQRGFCGDAPACVVKAPKLFERACPVKENSIAKPGCQIVPGDLDSRRGDGSSVLHGMYCTSVTIAEDSEERRW
jgi:hypothetical protein